MTPALGAGGGMHLLIYSFIYSRKMCLVTVALKELLWVLGLQVREPTKWENIY